MSMKNPLTLAGIEPATFRFVAQYFNHCTTAVLNLGSILFNFGSFSFTGTKFKNFEVLLTVHLSIIISVINQPDAQKFCFTISLFHASTCFEHRCS